MIHTHLSLLFYNHTFSKLTELASLASPTLSYTRPPWLHFDSVKEVDETFMPCYLENKVTCVYLFIPKAEYC